MNDIKYLNWSLSEGEKTVQSGIRLDHILQWIYEEETLYILTNQQRTEYGPVEVPVLIRSGKNKPTSIQKKLEVRDVSDFFTIKIIDKVAIEKFLAWEKENSI